MVTMVRLVIHLRCTIQQVHLILHGTALARLTNRGNSMKDYLTGVLVGIVGGSIITLTVCKKLYYEDGQVDCLNGAIHYKIEKQLDGSTRWVYSEEIVK